MAKRILISPLDWGMGHTTRCMPIIRHLERRGHTVILAGNEQQRAYWKVLAPQILTLPLQGYGVRYGRRGSRLPVLLQVPKILRAIDAEHRWLLETVQEQQIDGILSDNRYGLHHPRVPSVILTHQPGLLSGAGHIADSVLQKLHYRMLHRFGNCWIPDVAGSENLAGRLSHPPTLPARAQYIGLLTALSPPVVREERHILILLSGPEPQRSLLSQKLWDAAVNHNTPILFVEGSTAAPIRGNIPLHLQWYPQLSGAALQMALEAASIVICRSGYSTLMDLCRLQKKAILIPTPGQTEQEYLAAHLARQKMALTFPQKTFSLPAALDIARNTPFYTPMLKEGYSTHKAALDEWTAAI